MLIVCAPGHGGSDPGAVKNNITEKDYTMFLAVRTEERADNYDCQFEIVQHPGVTWLEDLSVSVNYAIERKADFYLAIHINSAENQEAKGFESFRYINASLENKRIHEVLHKAVAEYMVSQGFIDRGPKTADYYEVREPHLAGIPTVLLEIAFASNPDDAARLKNIKLLDKIANAIMWGLKVAFDLQPRNQAGQVQKLQEEIRRLRQVINNAGGILAPEMHK